MKDYYDFLLEEEKWVLDKGRFANNFTPDFRSRISDYLEPEYGIFCGASPFPTNHQIECFLKMRAVVDDDQFSFALFMEQGLGKTKVSLMMAEYLYAWGKIDGLIVISPNDIKYQWVEEEIPRHFPEDFRGVIWDGFGTQTARRKFGEVIKDKGALKVFSLNIEAFSSTTVKQYVHMFAKSCKDVMIIIDESTTIKNGRRKPVKDGKRDGAKRTNLILDGFAKRKYKMILTGTATPNRPFDLWSQFEFLRFNYFRKDYWEFCKYHGEMIQVKHANAKRASLELLDEKTYNLVKSDLKGCFPDECLHKETMRCKKPICEPANCPDYKRKGFTPWQLEDIALRRGLTESGVLRINQMKELVQFKNLDQLREQITPITYFRKTTEVLDMPPQIYEKLPCQMSAEQKKLYKEMTTSMMAEYEGKMVSTLFKQVMYIRCQQIAGGLFPYPVEVIKKGIEDERVMQEYRTVPIKTNGKLTALSTALDDVDPDQSRIYWAWFTGEQDLIYDMLCKKYGDHRVGLYRENKNETKKSFQAGEIKHFVSGDSGSFGLNLQVAYLQYFYSNNHRADIRDQKEKRSHRMGQEHPVTYIDVVAKGSKDQNILNVLRRKMDLMEFFRKGEPDE